MKLSKRIVALGAAALMSLSLTACGDTSWVYKTEDTTVASGVYLGYMTETYLNAQSHKDYDPEIKNIWKQKLDGKSLKDYISSEAESSSKRYLAISEKFDEMKLELSDEDLKNIDNQVSAMWDMYGFDKYYQPNGTSKESFKKILTTATKESLIFDAYYGKGGLEEVKKDLIVKTLLSEYVDLNFFEISFAKEDGTVLKNEEIQDLKEKAEDYADRINSGENSFNEVMTEYEDETAKADAKKNDVEFTPTDPKDIQKDAETKALYSKKDTSLPEDFIKAVFDEIPTGKATVITVDTSYYVVMKYDINDDLDKNLETATGAILNELKGEDFDAMVDKWMKDLTVESNTSSLHKYDPKNIEIPEE